MERCPNCRARCEGRETCRRCGMDLSHLIAVEQAAERLILRGIGHLAAGEHAAAGVELKRAHDLRREPFTLLLRGFAGELAQESRE